MPLNIEDFTGGENKLTPADFQGAVPPGTQLGQRSAAQVAATQSLLTNTDPEAYEATKRMLLDPRSRGQFAAEQENLRAAIYEDSLSGLLDMVADTERPQEEKVRLADGAGAGPVVPNSRTPNLDLLAEESLVADSGTDENEAQADARFSLLDTISEVNERKTRISNAINSLRLGEDQGLAGTALDIAESFAPLVEWNNIDQLLRSAIREHGADSPQAILLGSQKEQLYSMIETMPSTERERFAYAMIDLVRQQDTVLLPDGNDIMALDNLEKMLLDGNYSDFERWFDNATSILDVVGVGALARGVIKGGRAAGNVAEAVDSSRASGNLGDVSTPESNQLGGLNGEILDGEVVTGNPDRVTIQAGDVIEGEYEDVTGSLIDGPETPSIPSDTEVLRIARSNATRSDVPPVAPSQVVKDTNPEMARRMHQAVVDDDTGQAAEALYGADDVEAIARDLLPEPEVVSGRIPNKVEMTRPQFEEPADIRRARLANGNTAVSSPELAKVRDKLIQGFENVEGMNLHAASLVVKSVDDGTTSIRARYSPIDSGFTTADQAYNNAEFAFRNYGLQRDNFTLLARQGDEWVEVADDAIPEGSQLSVGLDFNYRFRPEDLDEVELLTTGSPVTRVLDSIPTQFLAKSGQGSLVQNLLDAASVIHPQIVNAASVAVDRSFGMKKLYVDEFSEFTKTYSSMKMDRRAQMTDYINKANFEGIRFDVTDLAARGFSPKEIEALKQWRRANDAMWHASNADLVKTLRGRGFKTVVHKDSDTKLVGRPVSKGTVSGRSVAYDPVSGANVATDTARMNDLYDNGGEVIKLEQPIDIDGQWVDYVISNNTPEGSYTRVIYDSESVLTYRDGYYPVMYDANYFVTKTVMTADGPVDKVVGSTKNRVEADSAVGRLRQSDSESTYSYRKDRRFGQSRQELDEQSWALVSNSGLTSQKIRGQRLADLGADLHKEGASNLKDPLEAVANQIHQLSQRVSMRTYLDTVKRRWMLNYGQHLDLPVNPKTGQTEFPSSVGVLKGKEGVKMGLVADARTNYNYITSLENGYINGIDAGYKAVLHTFSDFVAELGFGKIEGAILDGAAVAPTQAAKTVAFKLFLSSNPARQAVVQRGQILMLGAVNPKYATTSLARDLVNLDVARAKDRLGMKIDPKVQDLFDDVKSSGVIESVDAHNLIREDSLRLADLTTSEKVRSALSSPINVLQKVGFDLAEQDNLLAAYLAHRDLAKKAGKNLKDQRVKDEILGDTRAFTLNMNRAGEMPYSQNTLGLAAQFFSFQHKALLQGLTNKSLKPKDRAKVLAYTTAMFGIEGSVLKYGYDWAMEGQPPGEFRDAVEEGLLDVTLNQALTMASGEQQDIDWGDLAPVEAYGMGNMLTGMLSSGLSDFVANSPAGSLLFGANPRINDMFRTAAKLFVPPLDYEDPNLQVTLGDVAMSAANLFSGYSSAFKARYALENRQKMSSSGSITDSEVTNIEAALAVLGFQTRTESGYRETREIQYGDSEFTSDDVQQWYLDLKRHLARRGDRIPEEDALRQAVLSEAWRVFGSDRPKAMDEIMRAIQRDASDGDYKMLTGMIREMGYRTDEDMWKMISTLPAGQTRDRLTQLMQNKESEQENVN